MVVPCSYFCILVDARASIPFDLRIFILECYLTDGVLENKMAINSDLDPIVLKIVEDNKRESPHLYQPIKLCDQCLSIYQAFVKSLHSAFHDNHSCYLSNAQQCTKPLSSPVFSHEWQPCY